ncbi:MAG TPA: adenosylmethionine--8-amino-7-oxononanoate transaminase [Puia sp.]|nr:adenosylmethionine--8-amino-7-oxononanoate transaminase [Puia sp.]
MPLSLAERDQEVIWHPYTQHKDRLPSIAIVSGKGASLYDEKGRAYLDAISSWWVNIHGHAHPYIAEKIYEQAKKLEHVIFTGFTHEPAVRLAERLLPILPGNFSRIFYSDNGSTAVEVSIKMAIQYWQNQPGTAHAHTRKKILAFRNAYHGDTFGAMSVSDRGIFTMAFRDYLFEVIFIDTPSIDNLDQARSILAAHGEKICCFIYEPLLQGAGGMKIHDPQPLDELIREVQSHGILCIADEVLTGFGRTGKLFAGEYLHSSPDMICLSKGLTGGTMALGVTAASKKIFDAFLSDDKMKTLFHGHSFTANPIACTAALASLDLLDNTDCMQRIRAVEEKNKAMVSRLGSGSSSVRNIRQLGTILAFDIGSGRDGYLNQISARVTEKAIKNGIYLRPLGNTVYLMPPYCITEAELNKLYEFLLELTVTIN